VTTGKHSSHNLSCSANWRLRTTLDRQTPFGYQKRDAEEDLLRAFRRRAHNFLAAEHLPADDMSGEWLALMQHFGAPTRLLDFTHSPFVAAYFAFEDPPPDSTLPSTEDPDAEHADRPAPIPNSTIECAIWALNTRWCLQKFGDFAAAKGLFDFTLDDLTKMGGAPKDPIQSMFIGSLMKQKLERHALDHIGNAVCVFEPFRISERMAAQQGVFLWRGNLHQSVIMNLAAFGDVTNNVRLFTVPLINRSRALDQLRLMNITRASLFPGLDGFAQSFRNALVNETETERQNRNSRRALKELDQRIQGQGYVAFVPPPPTLT